MARSRLEDLASNFKSEVEVLHEKFLAISGNSACTGCRGAGCGGAILATWLQTKWSEFTEDLIVTSAVGTRRTRGTSFKPVAGVRSRSDAERMVKTAAASTAKNRGNLYPVWHSPKFVIDVGNCMGLHNLPQLVASLGPAIAPEQITGFRNYLVHPTNKTRQKYEQLRTKLGMHRMEPEDLLHQLHAPNLTVFTLWVRELQRIADAATQ